VVRIADPLRVAFRAGAGVQVVGRCDAHRRRRLFVRETPAQRFAPWDGTAVLLLQPDLPERLQRREVTEVRRTLGGPHPVQELIAICATLLGEGLALARIFRQARLVRSETVAVVPLQGYVLLDPSGVGGAALIERIMHGFSLRCQARMVSGLTIFATSSSACLPSFWPISASVFRSPSVNRTRPVIW
jgi:hypothetical protein